MGRGARPVKAKARSTVTEKSRKIDGSTGLQFKQRLAAALEQHAAISEILNVMSASPSDVQPVLDAVAERAAHLCEAPLALVLLVDGDVFRAMAEYSLDGTSQGRMDPLPLKRTTIIGRAVLDCATIHHDDVVPLLETEYPDALNARRRGLRAVLAVPLIREGKAYGAILLWRREPGLFARDQVALVQTFAQQAAIAIENVRLFNETKEGLEQQTATSEILRVISTSPTNVQPVFDAMVESAVRLCEARFGAVFRLDRGLVHLAANHNFSETQLALLQAKYPMTPNRGHISGRAILVATPVQIPDIFADEEYRSAEAKEAGFRSLLGVPMLRGGRAIGAIVIYRTEAGQFADKHIELLKTFADQAVIAIENVRLFNETKEALEQQTATSEILKVISSSPTDVQPVFDTIVRSVVRLCGGWSSALYRWDGALIHNVALSNPSEEDRAEYARVFPMAPSPELPIGRVVTGGTILHIADALSDPGTPEVGRKIAQLRGYRGMLMVPMLREGSVVGVIAVSRVEPGLFTDTQVKLVQTFADQAVIAIENVRLFKELEARTTQLTRSVGELKALGEVGHAVSSTLDLETVLSTIASRATQLARMDGGAIHEYDEARGEFHLRTTSNLPDELVAAFQAAPVAKGEGAVGRMAATREPVQFNDIAETGSYHSRIREILVRYGYRSVLAVPLLREDHLLGGLVVLRKIAGEFEPQVIDLLKTFATQSALAIQNARLYREIEVKSRELEAASRHKSEFLANMSHELRTPLNAIIGFSEVLSERMFGEINEKQAEYIGDILQSGQHLLSLINDILDLSKIEAGRMELELNDFDLPSTIENTLTLVRERAVRRGIELGRTIDERLGLVRADERKVKQVLLNLLSNALKFTPEGGKISVSAALQDGMAEISVADTGVGIAPEDQQAVFEEFRQVGTVSKKVEGTGLGLAISKKFIELHGGRIWVKSSVGKGSTFAFALPLQ